MTAAPATTAAQSTAWMIALTSTVPPFGITTERHA